MKGMIEINNLIASVASDFDDNEVINTHYLVNQVMDVINNDNENKDAWLFCLALDNLTSKTNAFFRKLKQKSSSTDISQSEFREAGFHYLQDRYSCHHNGEVGLVPTNMMSEEQIDEQITLHKKQADGHLAHADELERFKRMKFGPVAANDDNWFDIES